ncbi:MAG TPA: fatty acid desaturase [Gemmataceae bacterium]|nr:fatty acid desaturase [Gemmataceae bacterium]
MNKQSTTGCVEHGESFPAVIQGDRTALSREAKQAIKRLARPQPVRFALRLTWTWTLILGAIGIAAAVPNPAVRVLAILFIATRQNVLALLLHEQVHRLAFRSRLGDLLCELTVAYPLLVTLNGYRKVHRDHHRHFFTEKDPDYRRKQGEEWAFPQQAGRLLKSFLTDATGFNSFRLLRSKRLDESAPTSDRDAVPGWLRPSFYAGLAIVLLATGTWNLFLLDWLLPLFSVFQVIVRWAALCEHRYDLGRTSVMEATPFIQLRWWESLILPDLYFHTFHAYHHWYPAVPCSGLAEVHAIFRREGLVQEGNMFQGYVQYLRYLLGRK